MEHLHQSRLPDEETGEETKMKCRLCNGEAIPKDQYCSLHRKAYDNVASNFKTWQKALGVSWKEYLRKLADNPLTGDAAKEVVKYMLSTGEK